MPSTEALLTDQIAAASAWAQDWLFNSALPLWWESGADHVNGGFHEKIDHQKNPVGAPTRVRVQTRQIYVFAEAGKLGWSGPWQKAMRHGLSFMLDRYPRSDGLFRSTLNSDDDAIDLYDQAFVVFALAQAYAAEGRPRELLQIAIRLLTRLDALLAHPLGGYEEANPRKLPLRSNPHMHLLEALLAWVSVGVDEPFRERAQRIVDLATARMIDPATGAVGEYYDGDWRAMPGPDGAVREPGHQFEWAYLLALADSVLGCDNTRQSVALEAFGSRYGIDAGREVAVFALDNRGCVTDSRARLWAQTERLRTSLVLGDKAQGSERERLRQCAISSFSTLRRYLSTPVPGLWWEWMDAEGSFIAEPAPASSLYHLVSAFTELCGSSPLRHKA
jgi:mannose-6-phosphate isomerase